MEIAFCWKGITAGFVLCAPLGPVGVLCLQRTMTAGRLARFCSILGAAVVDGFCGCFDVGSTDHLSNVCDFIEVDRIEKKGRYPWRRAVQQKF